MKKILLLVAGLFVINPLTGWGQVSGRMGTVTFSGQPIITADQSALTKFNLDFPGGTAAELVKAIEKAMGKPLNVIIASDEKSVQAKLPPIKVADMDAARLFRTLLENSRQYDEGRNVLKSVGFYTQDGNPTDNSLWTFSVYEKQSALTQFNLDFPGGTPADLVKAIEKATGKPMNVVIPDADADTKLPPLKMDNVNVVSLFKALEMASVKLVAVMNTSAYSGAIRLSNNSYSTYSSGYGFKTEGQPTDNSVWYFHVDKPALPPMVPNQKTCQFYSLSPYLDRGFTVDDITTAIQTGWKMAGETALPELNYHKETKLLIAYGEPDKLKTIDQVLETLPKSSISVATAGQYDAVIRSLQSQINELVKKVSPPTAPPSPTLEISR